MSGRNLRTLAAALLLTILIAGPAAALSAEGHSAAPAAGTGEEGGSLDPNGVKVGDEGGSLDPNG